MLEAIHQRFSADMSGALADYIPQLAAVDPRLFGLALAGVSGRVYCAGDADAPFTIQSASKPFVYAIALADHGLEAVLERVGAEPSGEAFNAASLEPTTGRPFNPMINAGAIVTTSLVGAVGPAERYERIRAVLSAFAGRELTHDQAVYRSESDTGDKNRSLGFLMRSAGSLRADVEATVDVYFKQCAIVVTARDLAVMAATLANGGVNPCTGVAVVSDQVASHVLTIMGTCGMYDASGEWLLRVGLPAKSGVSGALLAVKPAQFGAGLFSPLLDARGNSVRGIASCREMANRFELHLLNYPGRPSPATYLDTTAALLHSSKRRDAAQRSRLAQEGDAIVVRGLQGEITFAAAEEVLVACEQLSEQVRWLIFDVERVVALRRSGRAVLDALVRELGLQGVETVIADPGRRGLVAGAAEFGSRDTALERCEDALLETELPNQEVTR
ncbi:MAG: glutaminase A [Chloroflexi bacterium]|nr:MAG: glutaminase A [Chloroflexota bacterium]